MGNMFSLELRPRGKVLKNAAPRPIHQTPLAPSDTGQTKKRLGLGVYLSGRDRSASASRCAPRRARKSLGHTRIRG